MATVGPVLNERELFKILQNISENVEGLGRTTQSLNTKIGSLDTKIGSLDTKIGSLDAKIESLDAKFDQRFDKLEARVSSLEGHVKSTGDIVRELSSEVIYLDVSRINLTWQVEDMRKEFESFNNMFEDVKDVPVPQPPVFAHSRKSSELVPMSSGIIITPQPVDDTLAGPGPSAGKSGRARLMVGRFIGSFVSTPNLKKKAQEQQEEE